MKTRKTLFILAAICFGLMIVLNYFTSFALHSEGALQDFVLKLITTQIWHGVAHLWLTAFSIIFALAGFLIPDEQQQPVNKWYRYATIAFMLFFATVLVLTLCERAIDPDYLSSLMHRPLGLFQILRFATLAWLILLVCQQSIGNISPKLRNLIVVGLCVTAFPVLLNIAEIIGNCLHVREYTFSLYASSFLSWSSLFVSAILLFAYCQKQLGLTDALKKLHHAIRGRIRSDYVCHPTLQRAYPVMRIGVFVLLICATTYMFLTGYDVDVLFQYVVITMFLVAWLMLTFMAFFQLPRSIFRLIYNAVLFTLTAVLLILGAYKNDEDLIMPGCLFIILHFVINVIRMIRHREI